MNQELEERIEKLEESVQAITDILEKQTGIMRKQHQFTKSILQDLEKAESRLLAKISSMAMIIPN